jgi:hypothetical protein
MEPQATAEYQESDIFEWANNLFQYKEDLHFELFLLSKNNVLYRTKTSPKLKAQLHPLFLDEILEYVLAGAQTGLVVRSFEEAEGEENVLQRTQVTKVDELQQVINWLKTQEHEIEQFDESQHDLKRMRGLVVRCSHSGMQPFYVIKQLPMAQMFKGEGAWSSEGALFTPVETTVLRIPADNQMLVVGQDLFVFNQAKLERLFGYNAKKNSIAEKKARAIETQFNLSFADDASLQSLIKGNKTLINKLQKLDPSIIKQDQVIDHADEMGLDLMVDESGAIIIMNVRDLTTLINLLNDDYVESALTGQRYEIKTKRPIKLVEADN